MRENEPGFIGGHSDGIVEVTGSIPVGSTNQNKDLNATD
jgi:hypothetical protein